MSSQWLHTRKVVMSPVDPDSLSGMPGGCARPRSGYRDRTSR
jgi:hypothetical protein